MKRRIAILFIMGCLLFSVCAEAENSLQGSALVAEKSSIETEVLAKTSYSWNGALLPAYPESQPKITILHIKIPPGAKLPMHSHPVINAGVLLRGELTVITKSGAVLDLREGDAIVEVVDTWHYGRNEGTEAAEIVVFYAGAEDMAITEYYEGSV